MGKGTVRGERVAAKKGLLGTDRLIACSPGELHLKFGNVLRAFLPVGV